MDIYKKSDVASIVKIKRIEKGLSQAELARQVGYKSRSTINKIELGINDIPRSKIDSFAKALEVDPCLFVRSCNNETDQLLEIISGLNNEQILQLLRFAQTIAEK